ncbi:hypothetical protein [Pseudomonas nicosulfuronedens]
MPEATKRRILEGFERSGLSQLASRPYDCAFELLAAPRERKRLMVVGFNGSLADDSYTNESSITGGFESPMFSNVAHGKEGGWGKTPLAHRLTDLAEGLGFDWRDTVYTNALLMCSKDAVAAKTVAAATHHRHLDAVIAASMRYFEEVTISLCKPELIVAYSNSLANHSTARILLRAFGGDDAPAYEMASGYFTMFSFMASIADQKIPVVCVRHMSRFKPASLLVRNAWQHQLKRLT